MNTKKIFFFTLSVEHTTHRKSAQMLSNAGADVKMAGFTRNNFPTTELNNFPVTVIGRLAHGNYLKRLFVLLIMVFKLRKEASEYDVVYCFTLDALLISKIAMLFSGKKWVYQVQDIRPIFFGDSIRSRLARFLERKMLDRIDLLVLSSENYFIGHFKKNYGFDFRKVEIIENKVDPCLPRVEAGCKKIEVSGVVFGYFGVLRCKRSWDILYKLSKYATGRVGLYVRGKPDAIDEIEAQISGCKNIEYGGLYKSPDDLGELYGAVDLVWACYPYSKSDSGNWKMARTIRFYEALAFGKPVIVQKGTAQEEIVKEFNIGIVVDMSRPDDVVSELGKVSHADVEVWKRNIESLEKSYFLHTDEYSLLLTRIGRI